MGVPYYVDKRFEKEYHGAALDELEKTIESDYIEYLQNSCWKEKQQSKPAVDTELTARPELSGVSPSRGGTSRANPFHSGNWSETFQSFH